MRKPEETYFAVIFTSELSDDHDGYDEMAGQMETLARSQEGFLGMESVREGRSGITVSYWKSETDVLSWKRNLAHLEAQKVGRERWYSSYRVRVAKVEREYDHG